MNARPCRVRVCAAAFVTAAMWASGAIAAETETFVPAEAMRQPGLPAQEPTVERLVEVPADAPPVPAPCDFGGAKFPKNAEVFAAGSYGGRELDFALDDSGHIAHQIDVTVNSPDKPALLMLAAYEPMIWNIRWTQGTKIAGVVISGYHRPVVSGLPLSVPLAVRTDSGRQCDRFSIDRPVALNSVARQLFDRDVAQIQDARHGAVLMGKAVPANAKLVTSPDRPPESWRANAPLAGDAALQDAVQKGILRPATDADVQEWEAARQAAQQRRAEQTPQRGEDGKPLPPAVRARLQTMNQDNRSTRMLAGDVDRGRTFVVLQAFRFPAGLYGADSASFILPEGVPEPTGERGHSSLYYLRDGSCSGALCN